jgi:hypothetical protein
MRMLHRLKPNRAGATQSHTSIVPVRIGRPFGEGHDLGEPRAPHAEGALGHPSKIVGLMRRVGWGLPLAVLGASGQWHAAAVVVPPAGTNRVALTWGSLGSGTLYFVQTSTNLLTWTTVTNTTATNVSLTFIGDKARMFRLSASNAPPRSVTLAWDPSPGANAIANYNVYYGVASATYTNVVAAGTNTTVSISNLVNATTYYFATTAVDTSGLESDYSSEAVWKCPLRLKLQRLP